MAESRIVRNYDYMKVKTSTETPTSLKERPSLDLRSIASSGSSRSSDDWLHICPDCRRKMFVSKNETSSDDGEHESTNNESISWTDYSNLSDASYSSSGSGYMSASSSLDDSITSSENSDTSRYYCDRSASSSSPCSDTEIISGISNDGDETFDVSSSERERSKMKLSYLEREE